jgi:hypothetical protein
MMQKISDIETELLTRFNDLPSGFSSNYKAVYNQLLDEEIDRLEAQGVLIDWDN